MSLTAPIVTPLVSSMRMAEMMCQDLTPAEYLHRPCDGANCAAWILGHLVLSERHFATRIGAADLTPLPEGFDKRFGQKEDAPQAKDFGDVTLLVPLLKAMRQKTIEGVQNATPEKLATPLEKPHPIVGATIGELVAFAALHMATHVGHLSTIRRSLGRPPLI